MPPKKRNSPANASHWVKKKRTDVPQPVGIAPRPLKKNK